MTSTTDLPARFCVMRVEIPVTFEVRIDTESDLGLRAYEHFTASPDQIPVWLDASLDVAYTLANARTDEQAPAVNISAHISDDQADPSNGKD
jgi:hypothetical protein